MSFFSNNYDEFWASNEGMPKYALDYVTYVETRLGTNISLLNNPALMAELDISRRDLLEETKKLLEVSKRVKIPEIVEKRKGFFR